MPSSSMSPNSLTSEDDNGFPPFVLIPGESEPQGASRGLFPATRG